LSYDGTTSDCIRLKDDDGTQYLVEVTEELQGAVRRLGALAQKLAQELDADLRPRDIQALIRSGIGPEELAQAAGIDPEVVWRYAGPVVDERAWIASRAQEEPVSPDDDAPLLGELALDRLATRGVSPDSMTWDAVRDRGRWIVTLAYSSGEGDAEARWAVDLSAHSVEALDDDAAWISETVMPDGPIPFDPGRPFAAIDGGMADDPDDVPGAPAGERVGETSDLGVALLDDLMSSRGLRQPLEPPPDVVEPDLTPVPPPSDPVSDDDGGSADILRLLPPIEAEDTKAPLYSPLGGSGRPSRRSILDRQQAAQTDEPKPDAAGAAGGAEPPKPDMPKPGRAPASSLEEDAPVGQEPGAAGNAPAEPDRSRRRRPTRRSARNQPPPAQPTPSGEDAPQPPKPEPAAAAPTEVVSLLPLDQLADPPEEAEPAAPKQAKSRRAQAAETKTPNKDKDEAKPRSRSRRSSVPSWDEIVFGAKPDN
jgi:hypothetical protein